ncbi:MAG: hypothetical protein ACOY5Y_13415 [Pseudomonadota bacterium]|jgi:hypothetical protein
MIRRAAWAVDAGMNRTADFAWTPARRRRMRLPRWAFVAWLFQQRRRVLAA